MFAKAHATAERAEPEAPEPATISAPAPVECVEPGPEDAGRIEALEAKVAELSATVQRNEWTITDLVARLDKTLREQAGRLDELTRTAAAAGFATAKNWKEIEVLFERTADGVTVGKIARRNHDAIRDLRDREDRELEERQERNAKRSAEELLREIRSLIAEAGS